MYEQEIRAVLLRLADKIRADPDAYVATFMAICAEIVSKVEPDYWPVLVAKLNENADVISGLLERLCEIRA